VIHARGGIQVYPYQRLDRICLEDPNAPPTEPLQLPVIISGLGGATAPRIGGGGVGGINPQVCNKVIVATAAPPERQIPRDDGTSVIVVTQPTVRREENQDPRAHVVQGNRR